MDFSRRMIRPEVEGSTQQTLTAQRKEDEREGIQMRNNRDYNEDFFCKVNGIDVYCRDARQNMECNWSNDYPWENRDAVEIYMSRRGFRVESLLFSY